jgi:hypothetical protein
MKKKKILPIEIPPHIKPMRMRSRKEVRFVNKSCRQRGANSRTSSARNTMAVNVSKATESFRLACDGRLELGERSVSKNVAKLTNTKE